MEHEQGITFTFENFDTSNVTSMSQWFTDGEDIISLDLSGWDTSNVENVNSMFNRCYLLTSLNLTGWDLSNCTNFTMMLGDVSSNIVITCSAETKAIIMAHNGTGTGKIGITLTDANFIVV